MRKPEKQTSVIRITSGAAPRLRLMSVRSNRGRRVRAFAAFVLSFLLAASGFYGTKSLAQSNEPWDGNPANGDVEVSFDKVNISSSLSLTLKAGESVTYWIRLSRQPLEDGWFVRIFVNGSVRSEGKYPPEASYGTADFTWVPSVGWNFDVEGSKQPEEPTRWRGVTFRAKKDITTPIKIMHEVWAKGGECPMHERGKVTISAPITNPGTTTPDTTNNNPVTTSNPATTNNNLVTNNNFVTTNDPGNNNDPGNDNDGNGNSNGNENGNENGEGDGNGNSNGGGNGGNGGGNEGKTSTVPGKPVLSATANGQTEISLSWDAPADNGAAVIRYELQVSDNGKSGWNGLGGRIPPSATSYTHPGLSAATTKNYQIRAHNAQGPGAWSDVASATTEASIPDRPEPLRATVDGNRLVLTYDEPLDSGSTPVPGDFTVRGHDVESLNVSGSRVTMILETPAMPGEEVTLTYTSGVKPIRNITGVDAVSFTDLPIENISKAPVLLEASVLDDQLTLTYDEPLDETSVPAAGSFTVTVDGANRAVSAVEIKGEKVTLALASAVAHGEEVAISYTPGSPRIVDLTEIPAGPINNLNTNNSTLKVDDDRARGTNDWLARFGRTVASQAVETIGNRLKAPSMRQASRVTIAGQDVDFFDDESPLPIAQEYPDFAAASRLASRTLGFGGLAGDDSAAGRREISMSELLLASAFHLTSALNTEDGGGALWTTWGRGSRTGFFGNEDNSTFEGDVTTGTLGADFEWGRTMVGVALSHTQGEGYFSIDGLRNDVEATLNAAYPYIRYTVSEHLTIWGMFGFGNGEYAQTEQDVGEKIETDISMRMGAFGFRNTLFPLANQVGYDLAVKGDVLLVEIEAEEVRDKLLPVDTNANRFRLLLEGSREYKVSHGASITPSLAMGVRYDRGDAEEGGGIELGGGFRFFVPSRDLVIDVNARGLLVHEESRFGDMGVSGSVHLIWGTKKKGLSVRVGSSWGDPARLAERLWSQASTASLASDVQNGNARLEAEVGYGIDVPGGGFITPYAGLALAEKGSEIYRVGGRLRVGDRVSLKLEGDRRERVGGDASHGLALLGSIRW